MKKFKLINNVTGWIVFFLSSLVFILTMEPTASFWDCGEFIATCFKLEVGHPPGSPLFMIMGRFFTLFAAGDVTVVPVTVNIMSALVSGGAVLFTFWSITHLARKMIIKEGEEIVLGNIIAVMGSGFVGAMAFCFADSFWFSAVEGEVYASSSFFTAIVVWAIFKWENAAHEKYSNRWLILCAYLMGLSIGVHLLNLLTIPALVFVYYFKKYNVTRMGVIKASIASVLILIFIMYGIIPYTVKIASWFELLFINGFGMPYSSGMIIWCLVLAAIICGLLYWSLKKKKVLLNTIMLCIAFIVLGYSSVIMIVVRSNANPPLDENNPENAFSLLSYLNREQYGDRPLFYGQYYNAPVDRQNPYNEGDPNYVQLNGRYEIADYKMSYNYDSRFMTIFPRMWSPSKDHVSAYKQWGDIKGTPIQITNNQGKQETVNKPTFGENLRYFFRYQVGFMYFRYFLWNFSGRQNDIQGHGGILKGNWITGIPFIDNALIGPQKNLPESMKHNKGTNKYYLLPLILGITGLIYNYRKTKKDFWIVMLLFFFTGLAIVLYLNQYPYQPRERDYSYAGSFYAFAFWIGLGVVPLFNLLKKRIPVLVSAVAVSLVCTLLVPGIMAKENWDDHDRSNRYTSHDFAYNYLMSCAPNAIIFTNGDNDTFPLWYAQEVEGIRTDVRVVNLSLFNTDWYIEQQKRKAYDSDPIPTTMSYEHYMQGQRDIVFLVDDKNSFLDEKYSKNKAFEAQYMIFYEQLQKILERSKFPEQHKADYEKILKGYKFMNLIRFKSLVNNLAQKNMIEKYSLNEEAIKGIKTQTDKFIEAVANEYVPVEAAVNFIMNNKTNKQLKENDQEYCPTKKFSIPTDYEKVVKNGTVNPKDRKKIIPSIDWSLNKSYIMKAEMMVLDILATNKWERPIYFAITVGSDSYMNLEPYFQLEGFAYRLVPIKTTNKDGQLGRVASEIMYNNMMNKFKWGNMNDPTVYLDENNVRMIMNLRNNFARLADQFIDENKLDSAMKVLDRCEELIPDKIINYNYFNMGIADAYYRASKIDKNGTLLKDDNKMEKDGKISKPNALEKANEMVKRLADITVNDLNYYFSVGPEYAQGVDYEKRRSMMVMQELVRMTKQYKQDDLNKELEAKFNLLYQKYTATTNAGQQGGGNDEGE
ncbi:MAG: DUF2723 domain-containing protein [Bacteroidia bacterium]|nr:DUF2723 domain-containing protein [Bacteroidia bacterium]